jgi:hypothetical protein
MRTGPLVAVAGALLALAPHTADAQFQTYCAPGPFSACVGVQFVSSADGPVVRVQNLQTGADRPLMEVFDVTTITFTLNSTELLWRTGDPNFGGPPGVIQPDACGGFGTGLLVRRELCMRLLFGGRPGTLFPSPVGFTPLTSEFFLTPVSSPTPLSGILGCPALGSASHWRAVAATCPSEGYTGWLEIPLHFDLYDRTTGTIERTAVGLGDFTMSIGGRVGVQNVRIANITAVPEPSTWAMLGTGLLALGGVGYRRRKRAA